MQSDAAKGSDGDAAALKEQVEKYELAVESAWSDVQRAQAAAEETEARFDRAREFARRTAVEKEEMENTLLDVAADLENLARNYRQHGSPAMAVPLYVSALAIFEKTLGPEHPQVSGPPASSSAPRPAPSIAPFPQAPSAAPFPQAPSAAL